VVSDAIDKLEFARGLIVLSLVVATLANTHASIRNALCGVWLLVTLLIIIGGFLEHRGGRK
jgi:hypothetical protein